ncbi:MAG: cytochrome c oxidase subunit II [Anaerolineae bacterium]|nr:cytochrome c oxidase subunit II [Anaerolineales bacterium]MCQ3972146.1 cytochrome c oxidase subunit II [Anaerolineae bacterium]
MRSIKPVQFKRMLKAISYLSLLGTLLGLLPAVALAAPPSPLDPASPAARSIANLHTITLIVATLVFLIVCGLLIYSLVRFRRKSANDPEPDQSFHGNTTLEVIWTIIPVGILATLLVLTYQTLQDISPDRPTQMTIRAIGKQWLWEIQYPDHNIKLTNQIRVPVNTDVKVEITSQDVIHSFWIPQMGGKKDAVPGYLSTTWFKADRLGTFHGQCAEYCGLAHSKMPIELVVLDQASFDLWAEATAEQQANASAQGELLFGTAGCAGCHAINGQGGQIGPELTNVYVDKGPDYIHESIVNPNAVLAAQCPTGACPAGIMPQNFSEILSEDDINSIIEYLKEVSGATE